MQTEIIITTPRGGTGAKPFFSHTFRLNWMEFVEELKARPMDYGHVLNLIDNERLNKSFYKLLAKKLIPLEVEVKEADSILNLIGNIKLKPCLERDTIILIRNKKYGFWKFDFLRSHGSSCKNLIQHFDVHGILNGEKEVFFIEDRLDFKIFLAKFHYLSVNDVSKLTNLFDQNLGDLNYQNSEKMGDFSECSKKEVYTFVSDYDLPF